MKKLLLLIIGLLLLFSVEGQILRYSNYAATTPPEEEPEVENMLSNGTFEDATDWTLGTGWSISSNRLLWDHTTAESVTYQTADDMVTPITINTDYVLEFDLEYYDEEATTIVISFGFQGGAGSYIVQAEYVSGHHTLYFTTGAWIDVGGFQVDSPALWRGDGFYIDNILLYLDE